MTATVQVLSAFEWDEIGGGKLDPCEHTLDCRAPAVALATVWREGAADPEIEQRPLCCDGLVELLAVHGADAQVEDINI